MKPCGRVGLTRLVRRECLGIRTLEAEGTAKLEAGVCLKHLRTSTVGCRARVE